MAGRTAHDKQKARFGGEFQYPNWRPLEVQRHRYSKIAGFRPRYRGPGEGRTWLAEVPHAWGGSFANLRQAEPQSSFGLNELLEP